MADIKIDLTRITIVSVIAFVAGWLIFGLLGAILLAILVMVLMGIIKVVQGYFMIDEKKDGAEKTGEFVGNGVK